MILSPCTRSFLVHTPVNCLDPFSDFYQQGYLFISILCTQLSYSPIINLGSSKQAHASLSGSVCLFLLAPKGPPRQWKWTLIELHDSIVFPAAVSLFSSPFVLVSTQHTIARWQELLHFNRPLLCLPAIRLLVKCFPPFATTFIMFCSSGRHSF